MRGRCGMWSQSEVSLDLLPWHRLGAGLALLLCGPERRHVGEVLRVADYHVDELSDSRFGGLVAVGDVLPESLAGLDCSLLRDPRQVGLDLSGRHDHGQAAAAASDVGSLAAVDGAVDDLREVLAGFGDGHFAGGLTHTDSVPRCTNRTTDCATSFAPPGRSVTLSPGPSQLQVAPATTRGHPAPQPTGPPPSC